MAGMSSFLRRLDWDNGFRWMQMTHVPRHAKTGFKIFVIVLPCESFFWYDTNYTIKSVEAVAYKFTVGVIPKEGLAGLCDNDKDLKACFSLMPLTCDRQHLVNVMQCSMADGSVSNCQANAYSPSPIKWKPVLLIATKNRLLCLSMPLPNQIITELDMALKVFTQAFCCVI